MAHYVYENTHYELPDGLSPEEAKRKILTHLGRQDKEDFHKQLDLLGAPLDVGANLLGQMVGTPVAGLIAGAAAPFVGAQKAEGFRQDMMNNTFNAPAVTKTGARWNEAIGHGFEAARNFMVKEGSKTLGLIPGMEKLDAETPAEVASDLFLNFAPVHAAVTVPAKLAGKAIAKTAPTKPTISERLGEQPVQKPVTPVNSSERAMQDIVDSQLTGWNEPIRNNAPNPERAMPFIVQQLEQKRQAEAQAALEARQKEMELQVGRQTSLDMNAAERKRQLEAPVPGLEEARLREIEDSIARTQELNTRGQQLSIVEDYGNNDPMARMPNMRVDENGIPIRADLSIEAQQLQNPLQRNLWGDELPVATGDGGIPLTQAIDNMPAGPEKTAALSVFKGPRGKQAGALDPEAFAGGYRKINKILSKLTEAPWVRARFPASEYHTNSDGTPMILLHASTGAFNEKPKVVTAEGLHAGLGMEAPSFFVAARKYPQTTKSFMPAGRSAFSSHVKPGAAVYPMVPKKGNYPKVEFDAVDWSPDNLLSPGSHARTLFEVELGRLLEADRETASGYLDIIKHWVDNAPDQSATGRASEMAFYLKTLLDIDGFFYTNRHESLNAGSRETWNRLAQSGLKPRRQARLESLVKNTEDNLSFVTWNGDNLVSLYGDTATQISPPKQNTWMSGLGHSQAGGLNIKEISEGIKGLFAKAEKAPSIAVPKTPPKDSVEHPVSPETIAKKQELAKKANAIGLNAYSRVTTVEEALSLVKPEQDMTKYGANTLRSGSEAVLRTNSKNPVVNFIRSGSQLARNQAEVWSKKYVTGPNGVVSWTKKALKDIDKAADVAEALRWGDANGRVLTEADFQKLGWDENQIGLYKSVREGMDARYRTMTSEADLQGFQGVENRPGYVPSMFGGSYVSFVGFKTKEGRWVTTGIAQGATKWEVNKALEKYKEMGEKFAESLPIEYRGLSTKAKDSVRVNNGFAELVARLAELDPEGFGKAKLMADQHSKDAVRQLMHFDVHELKKHGVRGALGDRPWLTKEQNTRQFFEAMVSYLEDGFTYDSMQGFLMDAEKLVADSVVQRDLPKTAKWARLHLDHLRERNLSNLGAAVNNGLNTFFDFFGVGKEFPRAATSWMQATSTAWMMGFRNLGFGLVQLTQPIISGIPEAMRIRAETGLDVMAVADSFKNSVIYSPLVAFEKLSGHAPTHLKEAFSWGKERGLIDFSEAELAHEVSHSDARVTAKKIINAPIIYAEKWTRPPVFLAYVDMFHKAGFKGEEGFLRAQAATDYAMTNYNRQERPAIYDSLGEVGKMMSALSTYKHNMIEQTTSTVLNAKKHPSAAMAMLLNAYLFYGISGLPGYHEVNELIKKATGKNVREFVLANPDKPNSVLDGLISWYSDLDFQNKLSTAQVLPDFSNPLSVAPHLSKTIDVAGAAFTYAKNLDEASFRALAMKGLPTSEAHRYETSVLTDENGWVRKPSGEVAVEQPRTKGQTDVRRVLGIRPIQERLQADNTWTRTERIRKDTEGRTEASKRFTQALTLGDVGGAQAAMGDFLKHNGDPASVDAMMKAIENMALTPRQRGAGTPTGSLGSIYKYQEMTGQ